MVSFHRGHPPFPKNGLLNSGKIVPHCSALSRSNVSLKNCHGTYAIPTGMPANGSGLSGQPAGIGGQVGIGRPGMSAGQGFCAICRLGMEAGQGFCTICRLGIGAGQGFCAIGRPGMSAGQGFCAIGWHGIGSRQGFSGMGRCCLFWLHPQSAVV